VRSSNQVARDVIDFEGRLGIDSDRESVGARRWWDAATEARDKAIETGAEGVEVAGRFGSETLDRAKSVRDDITSGIIGRAQRWRREAESPDETD
jgi:hypothetical protein